MRTRGILALLGLSLLLPAAPVYASVSSAEHVVAVRAGSPPPNTLPIGGAWSKATTASNFYDFTLRAPAAFATTAYLFYDDKALYVAFHCVQSGTKISAAQQVDHAGVGSDDHVSLDIDTSTTGARVYQFRVNPLGVHDESSSENARYAPSWRSTALVEPNGDYDVLMTIPLYVIRAQAKSLQSWRFNFERFVASRNSDLTWAYDPAMQSVLSTQYWPLLTNIRISASATRPKPQANVYGLQSIGTDRGVFQNGIGNFQQTAPRMVGVDLTYPITNTLALVGTIDPDFSNVEQDQTITLPSEFQPLYTEYRPFFAQGAQYVNAVPQIGAFPGAANLLFYTPDIGIFDRGAKLEGTVGQSALGLMNIVGPALNDTALGYGYTTPDQSFSASTESIFANHSGSRDDVSSFGFTRQNVHSGESTQFEYAHEGDGSALDAHDLNLSEGLKNQHFDATVFLKDTSPGYDPVDGYTPVNDERGWNTFLGYNGTGSKNSAVSAYSVSLLADRFVSHLGGPRQADANIQYQWQFKNLISVSGFFGPSELEVSPGLVQWFNTRQVQLGYGVSTPQPLTATYNWGPFAGTYQQQISLSDTRVFGSYNARFDYSINVEHPLPGQSALNSQAFRRIAVTKSLGRESSVGFALRSINGTGGLASPGVNLSMLYQQRFTNQDYLYLEYGSAAAPQTLHRMILKYVFHAGGDSGT
jgi:hypothetical protein